MRRRVLIAVVAAPVAVALVALGRHNDTTSATTKPATTTASANTQMAAATTTPARPSTTTAAPTTISKALGNTDRIEREQPLVHALPNETTHYRIDYRVGQDGRLKLTITLLAVLNHDYQLATYRAQLVQYKGEALDYLRAQGQEPAGYTIGYEPAEAAAL